MRLGAQYWNKNVVACASSSLTAQQQSPLVYAPKHFHRYLLGHNFQHLTDHARLQWQEMATPAMQEYDHVP